ncbi:MAG: 1,2-phenylacetyl-CoA epoxidase subunit PaaE [Pseudomonadota bacterium]
MNTQFHPLEISAVRAETEDAIAVSFVVPDELKEQFAFQQGQYLTLEESIGGESVRRSYSICSGVNDDGLTVGIKKVEGGQFSTHAHEHFKVGQTVKVMQPAGGFTSSLDSGASKHYLCIAAGSGITPILSIISTVLDVEPMSEVTLLFGNQRVSSIMFKDELDALKNRYMSRFQLIHVLSRESREADILNGRIDNKKGAALCEHLLDLAAVDEFFLCGPEAMISEVSRGLRAFGIDGEKIHYELFGASAADAEAALAKHRERAANAQGRSSEVLVIADGRETRLELAPDGENILDAALDAGLDLPFACKGGACATCKARVTEGEVEMDVAHALEAHEAEAGFVLSCQAHPISERVVIDFDRAV